MRLVFADAFFWIASIAPSDDWHNRVNETFLSIQPCRLVTTEDVIGEVLAFYSNSGPYLRSKAIVVVESIHTDSNVDVVQQTHQSHLEGVELYKQRPDKGYSLVDCISMNVMKHLGIKEILTHDKHFSQEGFIVLFKDESS